MIDDFVSFSLSFLPGNLHPNFLFVGVFQLKFPCVDHVANVQFVTSDVIPRFLRFRIPTNGCFDNESVRSFQRKLLHKELVRAREEETGKIDQLEDCRNDIHAKAPLKTLQSIDFHAREHQAKAPRAHR